MKPTTRRFRYSSDVRLYLFADGLRLELAQVAPEFMILRTPTTLPRCPAEISVIVDGDETRYPVLLSNGSNPSDTVVEYEPRRA